MLQGTRTNYFGRGCPVYCVEPSWAGIILTFLDFSLDLPCLLHWLVPVDIPPFLRGFICHCPCCCSAIFHQQILGSCWVRECPAAPRAQTALSSFAIWGNCESPSVDLLFQQLLCCNRFLIWVAICLEQALPQLLISLLIWCLLRASLNLFVRYLQGRRPEQRSRPLLLAAQDGFSRPQSSSQDLPRQARRGLDGRGKLASGPKQDAAAGFAAKILRSGPGHRHLSSDPLPVRWDLLGDRWRSHHIQQRHVTRLPIGVGVPCILCRGWH